MKRLILVRHASPIVQPSIPGTEWRLSEAGVLESRRLATCLAPCQATVIFSSRERKSVETARALAEVWGLDVETCDGLHEHDRRDEPMLPAHDFQDQLRQLFARPSATVFGTETAAAAADRFTCAINKLIENAASDVVVVSHGTVIAQFVAAKTGVDGFTFWKMLRMPCAVTLTIPVLTLEGITHVDGSTCRPTERY